MKKIFVMIFVFVFLILSCDSGVKRINTGTNDGNDSDGTIHDGDDDDSADGDILSDDSPDPDKDNIIDDDSDINQPDNNEVPDEEIDPCYGVDCNGKGTCLLDVDNNPYCECEENFYPVLGELLCVNDCVNEFGDILSGSVCTHPVNQTKEWSKNCYIASCNPEGLCIGSASYNGHSCTHNLSSSTWDKPCYEGVCNDASCQAVKYPEGTACDDGIFCNGTEQCSEGGKCVSTGNPCSGGEPCNNVCNETKKNCFAPEDTSCDDGNPCTGENVCSDNGICLNGINPCDPMPCTPDPELEDGYFCCPDGTYGDNCGICVRMVIPSSMLPVVPDGKTWGKAYTNIQSAVNDLNGLSSIDCPGGKELWVAEGKYSISATITLNEGISLFGGFKEGAMTIDARNPQANKTVISGETLGTARIINMASNTTLDGLILSDSNYEHNNADRFGGAMFIDNRQNVAVRNCTFSNNRIVTNRNGFGGAIVVNNSQNITIFNSVFNENYASEGGGAIYNRNSSLLIEKSLFHKNNSNARGGGVHTDNAGKTTVINSIFTQNNAREFGGAVYTRHNNSVATVTNCSFWGNSITNNSNDAGSTFHNYDRSSAIIKNSIIWNSIRGNPIQNNSSSSTTATYSNITRSSGTHPGTGNINADPLFIDPENGNLKLSTGSPSINTGTADGAPSDDYEGNSRPKGAGYDMGAYEQ